MRKLNRLIAAGALAVPMALGASGIAGADVGNLADQEELPLPGADEISNEGGSGDQGADAREEGQMRGAELREEAQNLRDDLLEEAQNSRDESRADDASSNEGSEGDSDQEETQRAENVLEDIFKALEESSGGGSGGSNPTPLG